ncbi:MAG: STAS domain-containing protein [SAR324 cluster bacterium]|nr:STAS domain-containing protein [SAR324 cluster bacterium]
MRVDQSEKHGVKIFSIRGILAQTDSKIAKDLISPFVDDLDVKTIIINFEDVPFMDSSGLGVLVSFYNIMKENQRTFILCGLGGNLMEIMKTTCLDSIFTIYETEADALKAIQTDQT